MSTVAWWSGGITSAVACKLSLKDNPATRLVFIETGSHHPDTQRFKKDCETWYGKEIETIQHHKWQGHLNVCKALRFINSARGAVCTTQLKRRVREAWEKVNKVTTYVWGFENNPKEQKRADRVKDNMPEMSHQFPLITHGIDKQQAINIILQQGIEIPMMYRLGYNNNNCIGCPKGGKAYWNKIRIDFPDVFNDMAMLEREIGRSCIKDCFLDSLDPSAGRDSPPLVTACGATGEGCEIQESFSNQGEGL